MSAFMIAFAAEQAARRFPGWLRDVPALLAALFTAWRLWPDPVPAPLMFPEGADEWTLVQGLPPIVRPYLDQMPEGTWTG